MEGHEVRNNKASWGIMAIASVIEGEGLVVERGKWWGLENDFKFIFIQERGS